MLQFWNQLIGPVLDILHPKSILEIAVKSGDLSEKLGAYARSSGAKLTVINPFPQFDLLSFEKKYQDLLTYRRGWSLEHIPSSGAPPDIVFIDGDHNWHTVLNELRAIDTLTKDRTFPLVFLHHVDWPYGDRDSYLLPGRIPNEARHAYKEGGLEGGLNELQFHAMEKGGAKNGVRSAINDFLASTGRSLEQFHIQGFHGLLILAPRETLKALPELEAFLRSFVVTLAYERHASALESERIAEMLKSQELSSVVQHERMTSHHLKERVDFWKEQLRMREAELRHHLGTLSWRMTLPLRKAGHMLRKDGLPPRTPGNLHLVHGGALPVSVIVTARNHAPFLKECLTSIKSQTAKPMEILYCDDGSTDDSVRIAASVTGVRIHAIKHSGVTAARNIAVSQTTGDLLLHVDGDDVLPPDYLAHQLRALATNNAAAFAYGGMQMFGTQCETFPSQAFDLAKLWQCNFINTSALMRRSAFEAVGGWRDTAGTLWDWDLWLRMSRIGPGVASPAMLQYRRHENSWSHMKRQLNSEEIGLLFGRVRRAAAKVSIGAVVGGRVADLTDLWLSAIIESVRAYDGLTEAPELVILDNSPDFMMGDRIRDALKRHPDVFRQVLIIPYDVRFSWKSEMERRHGVARFLADAYNRLFAIMDGEIVWTIEDDVVVPRDAYSLLLRDLTDGEYPPAAVSGLYRNRHHDRLVAHRIGEAGTPVTIPDRYREPQPIDLCGTGCMMAFRPFITAPFKSHWRGHAPAHDWAWCDEIRKSGRQILLDPRVRCRHYTDAVSFV